MWEDDGEGMGNGGDASDFVPGCTVFALACCGVALLLVVGAGGRACGIVRIVSSKKGKVVVSHVSK